MYLVVGTSIKTYLEQIFSRALKTMSTQIISTRIYSHKFRLDFCMFNGFSRKITTAVDNMTHKSGFIILGLFDSSNI